MRDDHPVLRERDRLRDAIRLHRDSKRPSQRSERDQELYAALATARLDPEAARLLLRHRDYYDESPFLPEAPPVAD